MKAPAKIAILNVITVIALSVMIFVVVLLLAQNRTLTRDIKAQTDINQRYLRCILLIPQEEFKDTEQRVKAIDKCSLESRLPDGQPVGEAPTAEEREQEEVRQENQRSETQPTPAQPNPLPVAQTTPAPQRTTQTTAPTEPAPEPSVVEQVVNTVKGVLPL